MARSRSAVIKPRPPPVVEHRPGHLDHPAAGWVRPGAFPASGTQAFDASVIKDRIADSVRAVLESRHYYLRRVGGARYPHESLEWSAAVGAPSAGRPQERLLRITWAIAPPRGPQSAPVVVITAQTFFPDARDQQGQTKWFLGDDPSSVLLTLLS